MDLNDAQLATLRALASRIVPADDFPSASEAGFERFLERVWRDLGETSATRIREALDSLDAEAAAHYSTENNNGAFGNDQSGADGGETDRGFATLDPDRADRLIERIERGEIDSSWRRSAAAGFLRQMISLVMQSYYGSPDNGGNEGARSWEMIGFRPGPKRPFVAPKVSAPTTTPMGDVEPEYDAIVVGSGAGGGVVACVLAEAGRHVLLLERGAALSADQISRDHLRNHRFSMYGHNTGPELEGNPRVLENRGNESVLQPHQGGWHNNAMTLGGGTRVYAGQAWRMGPEDFRMASVYGVPEQSSLADWPFGYEELAPYYARAERELGVSGELGHSNTGPRGPYPMPPLSPDLDGAVLRRAGEELGWNIRALPLAINSVPYGGRPSCVGCGTCVGFACESEAKNGSANTFVPRALATGRCHLVTGSQVSRVLTDARGQAIGVEVLADGGPREVRAKTVVICAGAVETARLLLLSASDRHPNGLGNRYDQVGRNYQGHLYPGAVGVHPKTIRESLGPGSTVATCDWNHGNPGVIGGGMLANEAAFPIHLWSLFYPDLPRWGQAGKEAMKRAYRSTLIVMGPIQETPSPNARVTLDPKVKDRHGLPVVRLSGHIHAESFKASEMLRLRAEEWVRATGATAMRSWPGGDPGGLSGGQHQAGTCRLGDDPKTSVCDAWGRVHGQRRLFIADASLHVTNGGFNPFLTVMANAFRVAAGILGKGS